MRTALAGGLAAALMTPTATQARTLDLAPSSKWMVNYDRDSCTLTRAFGNDDNLVVAQFIQYEPGPNFSFHLIGKPLRTEGNLQDVRLRFGATGEFVRKTAMTGHSGTRPDRMTALFMSGRLDNVDGPPSGTSDAATFATERARFRATYPAVEAAVRSVTVQASGRTITLNLGSMTGPRREMRKCTDDLLKQWGLVPEEQQALASPPIPKANPNRWLRSTDYPLGSLHRGEQALIRYRLMIDAAGQPTACAVQSAIAKGDFAELSCALLKRRASFEPARKADGVATPSFSVGEIRWIMAP